MTDYHNSKSEDVPRNKEYFISKCTTRKKNTSQYLWRIINFKFITFCNCVWKLNFVAAVVLGWLVNISAKAATNEAQM